MGCCHGLEIPPDEEILNCQSIDEVIKKIEEKAGEYLNENKYLDEQSINIFALDQNKVAKQKIEEKKIEKIVEQNNNTGSAPTEVVLKEGENMPQNINPEDKKEDDLKKDKNDILESTKKEEEQFKTFDFTKSPKPLNEQQIQACYYILLIRMNMFGIDKINQISNIGEFKNKISIITGYLKINNFIYSVYNDLLNKYIGELDNLILTKSNEVPKLSESNKNE